MMRIMMMSLSGTKGIKSMAQKAQINEERLPIAGHPNRVMDWCTSEDEKKWWK